MKSSMNGNLPQAECQFDFLELFARRLVYLLAVR
jgi:hypothetical protein